MNQSINITFKDVFDYVINNTSYNPIEKYLDPTLFETCTDFIKNKKTGESIDQDPNYKFFLIKLEQLRSIAKEINLKDLESACEEMTESCPKKIFLNKCQI